jgi:hypothetical protein
MTERPVSTHAMLDEHSPAEDWFDSAPGEWDTALGIVETTRATYWLDRLIHGLDRPNYASNADPRGSGDGGDGGGGAGRE